jgi:hypothetical protein
MEDNQPSIQVLIEIKYTLLAISQHVQFESACKKKTDILLTYIQKNLSEKLVFRISALFTVAEL